MAARRAAGAPPGSACPVVGTSPTAAPEVACLGSHTLAAVPILR